MNIITQNPRRENFLVPEMHCRTIPIAKRRYYGRVQASVHEFLELGPDVLKADFSAPSIQRFFDPKGTLTTINAAFTICRISTPMKQSPLSVSTETTFLQV